MALEINYVAFNGYILKIHTT